MTLEELKKKAANGNQAAAMSLGDHYQEEKDYSTAYCYYEMAAQMGDNWTATYNAMLAARNAGCDHLAQRSYREAATYFSNAIRGAKKLRDGKFSAQIDRKSRERVRETLSECIYLHALVSYAQWQIQDVLDMLANARETKARLLRGMALCQILQTMEAFDFLTCIEDRTFRPEYWEEQRFFSDAAINMAGFYRTGLTGKPEKGLKRSVAILRSAMARVSDPQIKETLQKELSKYRLRLFGGYAYVK